MKNFFASILLIFISFGNVKAQSKITPSFDKSKKFFLYWGYNRATFAKSNIHVSGYHYDFTVYDVVAKDRPDKFTLRYFNPMLISTPQFNARIGFYINKNWSISMGYDHMKYVMETNRVYTVSGVIDSIASPKYAGSYLKERMMVNDDMMKFEHTDGFNVVTIDVDRYFHLHHFNKNWNLEANVGTGGIWVVPKSDVRIFGKGANNNLHVAGFTWLGKAGIKLNRKNVFFQAEVKGGYASLPSIFVNFHSEELADQNITYLEVSGVIGYVFPRKKKETK